ncbi:uncharacterized protein LOC113936472 isoform X2 [Zalophus californianus]|uniref:Uncharacterized protein LOC113936472 isoform X2 n=1 Tax=Zalophus californianus TaxID=9704 RepID=A0A6P9FGP8_ZALCA|nr:uncharacterized protein LOC113936472 isoform X2 [Zalophus californianus]
MLPVGPEASPWQVQGAAPPGVPPPRRQGLTWATSVLAPGEPDGAVLGLDHPPCRRCRTPEGLEGEALGEPKSPPTRVVQFPGGSVRREALKTRAGHAGNEVSAWRLLLKPLVKGVDRDDERARHPARGAPRATPEPTAPAGAPPSTGGSPGHPRAYSASRSRNPQARWRLSGTLPEPPSRRSLKINSSSPARSPGVIKFDILWDRESSTWKSARLSAVSGHAEASACTALPCCLCHQLSIQPRFSRPRDLMVELPWPEPPLQC